MNSIGTASMPPGAPASPGLGAVRETGRIASEFDIDTLPLDQAAGKNTTLIKRARLEIVKLDHGDGVRRIATATFRFYVEHQGRLVRPRDELELKPSLTELTMLGPSGEGRLSVRRVSGQVVALMPDGRRVVMEDGDEVVFAGQWMIRVEIEAERLLAQAWADTPAMPGAL